MRNPKDILSDYNIYPKKSLGQNFLHDPNAVRCIVDSAELPVNALVLEIGPGTGVMTQVLAENAAQVITIETDDRLIPLLEAELADYPNVQIIHDDFLKVNLTEMVGEQPYYVVANLPYYITSAILRKLLDHSNRPQCLVLTVQREVAERIMEESGKMSILSVSIQFYGKPQIVTRLNPAVFYPRPDVESAVLRIDVYDTPIVEVADVKNFFKVVRAGFSQKRKQIKNPLSGALGLKSKVTEELLTSANIDVKRRAETLSLEDWGALCRAYENYLATGEIPPAP